MKHQCSRVPLRVPKRGFFSVSIRALLKALGFWALGVGFRVLGFLAIRFRAPGFERLPLKGFYGFLWGVDRFPV